MVLFENIRLERNIRSVFIHFACKIHRFASLQNKGIKPVLFTLSQINFASYSLQTEYRGVPYRKTEKEKLLKEEGGVRRGEGAKSYEKAWSSTIYIKYSLGFMNVLVSDAFTSDV